MLQVFGEDIWIGDGPVASVAGFVYPTRMIVIHLSDGSILLWSPIAMTVALRAGVRRSAAPLTDLYPASTASAACRPESQALSTRGAISQSPQAASPRSGRCQAPIPALPDRA